MDEEKKTDGKQTGTLGFLLRERGAANFEKLIIRRRRMFERKSRCR